MAVEELCESINVISSLNVSLSAQRIDTGGMHARVIVKQRERSPGDHIPIERKTYYLNSVRLSKLGNI
jgi:hypothetical protein